MKDVLFLRVEVFFKTTITEIQYLDQIVLLSNRKKKKKMRSVWISVILFLPKELFMVEMTVLE